MNKNEKIARLQAIKEEFAATQIKLEDAKKLEESAEASNLATLLEADLVQAEIILAAQDMLSDLQGMAEDLAKMQAQGVFPLVDEMKAAFGPQAASAFETKAQEVLTAAMTAVRAAKEDMNTALLQVEGKLPMNDMAGDDAVAAEPDVDMAVEPEAPEVDDVAGDTILGGADDFGGAEAGAMGRVKKESVESDATVLEGKSHRFNDEDGEDAKAAKKADKEFRDERKNKRAVEEGKSHRFNDEDGEDAKAAKKADKEFRDERKNKKKIEESILTEAVILETAGKKLIQTEGLKSLVSWYLNEAAAAMPKADFSAFADKVASKAAQNPAKLAGFIGSKKYGHSAMAQLAEPTFTSMDQVMEGRSFRFDPEDMEDAKSAKKADKEWRRERKARRDIEDKEIDDNDDVKEAAEAIAALIESNIRNFGRGNAAKVVEMFTSSEDLLEGAGESILESFASLYGMTPALYSAKMARDLKEAELTTMDQRNANSAMTKVAGEMAKDKTLANKPLSAVLNKLDPKERSAVQKQQNIMRQNGADSQKVGDVIAGLGAENDDNK